MTKLQTTLKGAAKQRLRGVESKERINRRGIVSGDDGSGKYLVWFGSYTGDSNPQRKAESDK